MSKNARADALFPTAREIVELLDKRVVGQSVAKRTLATAAYGHYLLNAYESTRCKSIDTRYSNVLIAGPSGTGKTEIVRQLAGILGVPYSYSSATSLTQEGYAGEDAKDVIVRLLDSADWNTERAHSGLIFIDEIDKLATSVTTGSVAGRGAQMSLLPILDGNTIKIEKSGKSYAIDTQRLFIVAAGAFQGIRPPDEWEAAETGEHITLTELIDYGLIEELLGRFSRIITMDPLTTKDYREILFNASMLHDVYSLFEIHGIAFSISSEAVAAIAKQARRRGTGARGLASIVRDLLTDIELQLPRLHGRTVVLDRYKHDDSLCVTIDEPVGSSTRANKPARQTSTIAEQLRRKLATSISGHVHSIDPVAPTPSGKHASSRSATTNDRSCLSGPVHQRVTSLRKKFGWADTTPAMRRLWGLVFNQRQPLELEFLMLMCRVEGDLTISDLFKGVKL